MSGAVVFFAVVAVGATTTALVLAIRNGGLQAQLGETDRLRAGFEDALSHTTRELADRNRAHEEILKRRDTEIADLYLEIDLCDDEGTRGRAALRGLRRLLSRPDSAADDPAA